MKNVKISAIILCAGSSSRMDGVDKQLLEILDIPVFIRSVLAFENSKMIDEIVLVAKKEDVVKMKEELKRYNIKKVTGIALGGKNRFQSSKSGVLMTDENSEYILIHDGARPFVTINLINKVCEAVIKNKAVIPGVRLKDTIKLMNNEMVVATYERENLRAIQTPQGFSKELFLKAMASYESLGYNVIYDDSAIIEKYGANVFIVDGEEENIKITTKKDIALAEHIINTRAVRE